MNRFIFKLLPLLLLTVVVACKKQNVASGETAENSSSDVKFSVKYAEGFRLTYIDGGVLLDMQDPSDTTKGFVYHYALLRRGAKHSDIPTEYEKIETPVRSVVCMTVPQLSYFLKLDRLDKVVGMASARMLHNPKVVDAVQNGKIAKIGIDGNFDAETVVAINPQVILVSPFKRGGYETIKHLDIPLVPFLAYKETHPLGQTEWLKLVGILTGNEAEADRIFNAVETRYDSLKALVANVETRPTVMSGDLRSDNWYVIGGRNYQAEQFADAGAEYFMKDNTEQGGVFMDFESVYAKGANVDYWRMLNTDDDVFSYESIRATDTRYADFKAFKKKQIFYFDMKHDPIYEEIAVAPDVVLADLISIFHPDRLPAHKQIYYKLLTK